jgi:hypothetical protein
MKHGRGGMRDDTGVYWTLQQFCAGPTGRPWCAVQQQNDQGVLWPFTGYRHEVEAICQKRGITPEELPTTSEAEFLKAGRGELPKGPYCFSGGHCR